MSLSQVLAPQLQQSLALLQAPTLELKALVEQELQQNPILEEVAAENPTADKSDAEGEALPQVMDLAEPPADVQFDPATEKPSNAPVDDFQAEFERLSQMDQEWREHFAETNIAHRSREEEEEKRQFMMDSLVAGTSLQENLLEQMRTSDLPEKQQALAELIIGNIDDHGYLKATLEDLSASTGSTPAEIEEVLKVIQSFHPPGVGARDLRECLLLQLERTQRQGTLEYQIVSQYFDALGKRRIPELAKGTGADLDSVQEALARIARLDPRPGSDFLPDTDVYMVPEIFVTKSDDEYVVSTNTDHLPRLRISNTYKDLMSRAGSSTEVRDYIREKIRAGKFLIKSLHLRQQTILNIAREIVNRQREFLEKGVAFLKPLTMSQVAEVVGVHETTVSRAVSGKFMQTPQGVFEMKYFFTSGIQTATGQGMSNTSVKEVVAEIFSKENTTQPLSDDEVARRLKEKGIVIARRTVAKYRGELNILPSNLRKVY
ncbi:MAG: RNA polymerase factor sigma-54 [Verrucomicrobia bacterium]|nr:RNA polymerase factor sigma-54 [Verrucomicrobiota bacterium]